MISPQHLFQFLRSHECRRSHAILLVSSFATGLGIYGLHRYQTLTIEDLFQPALLWGAYWIPVALIWYTGWIFWSVIVSWWRKIDLIATMKEDAVSYVPMVLLLGLWIKHKDLPAVLALIPALSGFTALKLRPVLHLIRPEVLSHRFSLALVIIGMIAYAVTFSITGSLRFLAFQSYADFALFVQQVWNFSNLDYYFLSNMGWLPFANHFSPIIFLMAPFYWIWENPSTIITVQNAVIALGALPLFWMAYERLKSPVAGLTISVAYLLFPATQLPSLGDFHESLLVGTPILFGFYYLQRRLYRKAWIFIILVLMCKEDTPFIISMFGVYAWFFQHRRKQGLAILTVAVLWFLASVGIIMPLSQGGANWYFQFFPTGSSLGVASVPLLERLGGLVVHVFSLQHLIFILQLLIPIGALAALAPAEFLIGVPTLMELMLYTGPPFGSVGTINTWHVMAVVPAFFVSVIFGIERLVNIRWFQTLAGNHASLPLCLAYLCLSSISANIAYGVYPYSITFRTDVFQITPHDRTGHEIMALIPPKASVSTTSQISSHLAHRKDLYLLPIPFKPGSWYVEKALLPTKVDYIVADTSKAVLDEMTAGQDVGFLNEVREIGRHQDYETVIARDGYVVFKHKDIATGTK